MSEDERGGLDGAVERLLDLISLGELGPEIEGDITAVIRAYRKAAA